MVLTTVLGGVFVLTGAAIGWYAGRPLTVLPRLVRADVRDPTAVSESAPFVVCRGRAESLGESLGAPFTGAECLGLEYEVHRRQLGGLGLPFAWVRIDDGVATVPFELAGEHGRVSVRPDGRRFALDADGDVTTVGARETPPERIGSFVNVREKLARGEGTIATIAARLGLGARRYVERRIDPGAEYFVAGRPVHEDGRTALVGRLVIADRPPGAVARTRLRAALAPALFATIFVLVGTGLLVL